jgi:hypothetical protein
MQICEIINLIQGELWERLARTTIVDVSARSSRGTRIRDLTWAYLLSHTHASHPSKARFLVLKG